MTVDGAVGLLVTLGLFFTAQVVAAYLFFRREKRLEARQREVDRHHQLQEMKSIIDKDLGEIRHDLHAVDDKHLQNFEHLRASRPTRPEVEREIQQLKNIVEAQGQAQQSIMQHGFAAINTRFDEFKEYMREIQNHS